MIGATDIFVSYKAEDRARVQTLVAALEAEGFSVWWDTHIGGGAHWREDIEQHLDAAKCVIVVWSKRAVGPGGDFVRDEATRARKRGAYLPIRLDPVDPPLGFGEAQAISLRGWHGDQSDPRFLAISEAVRRRIAGEDIAHVVVPRERPAVSRRAMLAGGGTIAIAAVSGWLLYKPASANANRIAVLPFANLSGDPAQAYFSDGIAEELRSSLSRVGMQVIGRTSSDAVRNMDAKAAAAKLGVANILTGSVRRSPSTIRIEAELVGGADGVERWAQSYDRQPGDTIKIQTDIAENVAQALSIALGEAERAALTLGGTTDAVAQDLVLQSKNLGREASNADSYRQRLALADRAIARDPNYADAYVEKANALAHLSDSTPAETTHLLGEAEAVARKAVALAPRLGSAHAMLSGLAVDRLDYPSALQELQKALALSPNDPFAMAYGGNLALFGRGAEGLRISDRAVELDPLDGRAYWNKSSTLLALRRYREAIQTGRKALSLAPNLEGVHLVIGDALLLLGQPAKAKSEYEALGSDDPLRLAPLGLLAARIGDRARAEQVIAQLKRKAGDNNSYQYGEIYVQLGDKDRAFAEFDNAIRAKDEGLFLLNVDPFLDPIRDDPRYTALLRRLNFP